MLRSDIAAVGKISGRPEIIEQHWPIFRPTDFGASYFTAQAGVTVSSRNQSSCCPHKLSRNLHTQTRLVAANEGSTVIHEQPAHAIVLTMACACCLSEHKLESAIWMAALDDVTMSCKKHAGRIRCTTAAWKHSRKLQIC